ncbi:MAG TPA: class I SAM-dependent methyltransferase [Terriglobia bacterium]|nr:class I SAM-dependent methyltransferase [Terriglobia bacterium]
MQDTRLARAAVHEEYVGRVSLWSIYRFAYLVALRSLGRKNRTHALRLLLEPCNYWRNVEVPAVINRLGVKPGEKVLDIGSPKLPSLFIWYRLKAEVYATDLFPYFFEEYSSYAELLRPSFSGPAYHIEQQDARRLEYPDAHFDRVYAISVLEHIEDDGDSQAMREIARVLKLGGICCLTVPFGESYRESTIDYEIYFKKPVGGQPVFYERHYDPDSLQRRLVAPSGLRVLATQYYGERRLPYERLYNRLPRALRILVSPLGPAFSKLFLHSMEAPLRAKAALLVLQKGHGR